MAAKKTIKKKRPAKRVKKTVSKKTAPAKKIEKRGKDVKKKTGPPAAFLAHRWQKGQSGNPSGRPKGAVSMTAALRNILTKKCPAAWKKGLGLGKDATIKDGIMAAAVKAAAKGDHKFFNTILERMDGKVPDIVHSTSTTLENFSEEELGAIIQNGDDGDGDGDEGRGGTSDESKGDGAGSVQAPGDGDGGDAEDGGSP